MQAHRTCSPWPRELRERTGLTQAVFWKQVGVTQSAGSRYETKHCPPDYVLQLLSVVYEHEVSLERAKGSDFRMVELLKRDHPNLYRKIRNALRKGRKTMRARQSAEPRLAGIQGSFREPQGASRPTIWL